MSEKTMAVNESLEAVNPENTAIEAQTTKYMIGISDGLRYGIDDGKPRTLEEVGREFNVTRERIRQIEAKALRKLRHPSRSKQLKDFLD